MTNSTSSSNITFTDLPELEAIQCMVGYNIYKKRLFIGIYHTSSNTLHIKGNPFYTMKKSKNLQQGLYKAMKIASLKTQKPIVINDKKI